MAEVIAVNGDELVLQVRVKLDGSMLNMEEAIQSAVNEVGSLATAEALKRFDTTGAPIQIGHVRMTSKGKVRKCYETPYGAVHLERYVYQTSSGGKTYCPLDERARTIISSTPRFAKQISSKYAQLSAQEVLDDFKTNHGRPVARSFLQNIVDVVGSIAQAVEVDWMYETPKLDDVVSTVSVSLDGTCVLMVNEGWREAMTGTITLYNNTGERLHTIYLGAAPEYGKANFLERLEREVYRIKLQYPNATYVGIADGAKVNWDFLERHTQYKVLDFFHATEYLAAASHAMYPIDTSARKLWLDLACHRLKHEPQAASQLLDEMNNMLPNRQKQGLVDKLKSAITYFKNQRQRMDYNFYQMNNLPIGSGVTEAACKTLIKQRLCQSGMKWKNQGISMVLHLRALISTKGRWEQFWERINQAGLIGLAEIC
ncbi:ISKra4 family transposase [Legionella sp. MW5194]|uniref:ISKra4 family transposase n=1 Tax=Legionella sp. MW5194 TaxID=2662448 RepID=UPI00193CE6B7|nr:ISKra4 family transposase [Legionella sp. MW5194]QRN03474.1 ISKra4 family transposase [Legionella sp. MW5194]